MKRVESLDYLRGLMAVAVMVYHYIAWTLHIQTGLLGKVGIYAVATFYVLSGVSLGMVYRDRLNTGRDVLAFWTRRVFRIAPLLWLVTTLTLLSGHGSPSGVRIAENYSLAFGVVNPNGAIATGAWSIGNEVVFYALLPLLIRLPRRAFVVSGAVAALYAFVLLRPDASLPLQWSTYVQPLNHLFLFVGGVAIVTLPRIRFAGLLGVLAVAVFCAYPMTQQSEIVSGWARLVMAGCTLAVVLAVYQCNPTFRALPARVLGFFGQGCYSIYLLHPLVYRALPATGWVQIAASVAITLGLSYICYRRIEEPMMRLGGVVARRVALRPVTA